MLELSQKSQDTTQWLKAVLYGICICWVTTFHIQGVKFELKTGTTFIFLYAILVLLVLEAISIVLAKKKPQLQGITLLDLLLLAYFLLVWARLAIMEPTRFSSLHNMEFLGLAIFYLLVRKLPSFTYQTIYFGIMITGLAQAIYGLFQLYGLLPSNHAIFKLTGSFFNPGPYAGFLTPILIIALGFVIQNNNPKFSNSKEGFILKIFEKAVYFLPYITIIAILLVLPASRSRASWLAVIIPCFLLFWKTNFHTRFIAFLPAATRYFRIYVITTCLVSIALCIGAYYLKKDSADGRMLIWNSSVLMVKDKPIFGHGNNAFAAKYMNYQAEYLNQTQSHKYNQLADNVSYPYNFLLKTTAEFGFLGLIIVLGIALLPFDILRRNKHLKGSFYRVACYSLLAIIFFSLFAYPEEILAIKLILVVILAHISGSLPTKYLPFQSNWHPSLKYALVCLLLALPIAGILQINKFQKAYKLWQEADWAYFAGKYTEAITLYQNCYGLLGNNGVFLSNYGKTLALAGENERALEVLKQAEGGILNTVYLTTLGDVYKELGKSTLAEEAYKKASEMLPSRLFLKYLLSILYHDSGMREKAITTATDVLAMNPKIHSIAVDEIKEEMKLIINQNR